MVYEHLSPNHPLNEMADELQFQQQRFNHNYIIDYPRIEKAWNSSQIINNRIHTINPYGGKIILTMKEFFEVYASKIFGPFISPYSHDDRVIMRTFRIYFKMYRQGSKSK